MELRVDVPRLVLWHDLGYRSRGRRTAEREGRPPRSERARILAALSRLPVREQRALMVEAFAGAIGGMDDGQAGYIMRQVEALSQLVPGTSGREAATEVVAKLGMYLRSDAEPMLVRLCEVKLSGDGDVGP